MLTTEKTTRLRLLPVGTTTGFIVTCADCGRDLGQVDERPTVGLGKYVHDCRGLEPPHRLSQPRCACGTVMAYGDHEMLYCPNPRCDL